MYIHFLLFLVLLLKITAAVLLVFVLRLGVSCDNYMTCSIHEILADKCPVRYREYFYLFSCGTQHEQLNVQHSTHDTTNLFLCYTDTDE